MFNFLSKRKKLEAKIESLESENKTLHAIIKKNGVVSKGKDLKIKALFNDLSDLFTDYTETGMIREELKNYSKYLNFDKQLVVDINPPKESVEFLNKLYEAYEVTKQSNTMEFGGFSINDTTN